MGRRLRGNAGRCRSRPGPQSSKGRRGYDAVAYFTENGAVVGDPAISYQWQGATWQFSSVEHRTQFGADPVRYAPQFGGYCAFAVAQGTTADGDAQQWAIVKDKLYVNNNVSPRSFGIRTVMATSQLRTGIGR
ncbi:MAG: YHS domain-containing (seleno)protein [Steroidobacteraceae bacterium]